MDYSEDDFLLAAPENTQAAGLGSAWAVGYQLPLQIDCHIFFLLLYKYGHVREV